MFSTKNPPAVQRMPWPSIDEDDSDDEDVPQQRTMMGHDTWILNDQDLPWLEDADGMLFAVRCGYYHTCHRSCRAADITFTFNRSGDVDHDRWARIFRAASGGHIRSQR
jgi:hypothetical protein